MKTSLDDAQAEIKQLKNDLRACELKMEDDAGKREAHRREQVRMTAAINDLKGKLTAAEERVTEAEARAVAVEAKAAENWLQSKDGVLHKQRIVVQTKNQVQVDMMARINAALEELCPGQWEDIPEQWSKHQFDRQLVNDHNTTNFVESFNACTKPFKDLPVMNLLEARSWMMKKVGEMFDKAASINDDDLTEYAAKILEVRGDESRMCHILKAGGSEFEVRELHIRYPVKVDIQAFACGVWQRTGIPYRHALRVIHNEILDPTAFVLDYFKGKMYKVTYSTHMHPMPDPSQWPDFDFPEVQPPPLKRTKGRPTKVRRRRQDEPKKGRRSTLVHCSICHNLGHNARSCQGGLTAKQKKQAADTNTSTSASKTRARKKRGGPAFVSGKRKTVPESGHTPSKGLAKKSKKGH